ncbi:MAG: c-type cytochrome [Chloroflexi bacterium]|nr:c-type cytochrome [Chloroflexota bacterium]
MKKIVFAVLCLALIVVGLALTIGDVNAQPTGDAATTATGGRLYDKWWKVAPGAKEPTEDHPLWATQTTNKLTGKDTWRCKECHGWDYKGVDGVYGSGSHKTGFPGVFSAGQSKTVAELEAILKGSADPKHDFSTVMDAASITALATFLKEGLIDESKYVDASNKQPIGGDATRGKAKFDGTCAACHGATGTDLNFGSDDEPEFVGTVAKGNPWEFLNKGRFGQPGAKMPATIELGWKVEDVVDVLAYAQTLPTEAPKALPTTGGTRTGIPLIATGALGLLLLAAGVWLQRRARSV